MTKMDDKAFKKWLKQTETGIAKELKNSLAEHTANLCGLAKEFCPVDTGYLQKSITFEIQAGGTIGKVYTSTYYARFVELGTVYQYPQPYMKPAYNVVSEQFIDDINSILDDYLGR